MTNTYHNQKKSQEKDPLDPQTVFTIKHSDIPKGVTQCESHAWRKLNETEIACTKCPTVNLIRKEDMGVYINP